MLKYPHVSVFCTLNRVLQKHYKQLHQLSIRPYNSSEKPRGFLQRKMHDHFPNIVILKGRLHCDSFLYVLYRSIIFQKGICLHGMCIILQCTQPFYPSNAQKHFIVKRKLAYPVHLLFLRSSNKDLWEFNENFNRKKQERFV